MAAGLPGHLPPRCRLLWGSDAVLMWRFPLPGAQPLCRFQRLGPRYQTCAGLGLRLLLLFLLLMLGRQQLVPGVHLPLRRQKGQERWPPPPLDQQASPGTGRRSAGR